MFTKVLIANRGAIACRVIRTLKKMGIAAVAVYSDADVGTAHVAAADEAVYLGASPPAQSYLAAGKILAAAQRSGAQAIHPGYGFLSENADFAQSCRRAGIVFVGPRPEHMRAFGLKHSARELAQANCVLLLPGTDLLHRAADAQAQAARIGYPVMLKSTAGGGGIGMRVCRSAEELESAFVSIQRLAQTHFKDAGIYLEKYIEHARHIEVQIFGDGRGKVIALGERDCSVQRRNQKVIEEAPAPGLTNDQRRHLHAAAVRLAAAIDYESAGTVEFVYDVDTDRYYFLEVNTRLQVEHGVTEEVTGIDLVEWMLRQAAGGFHLPDAVPVTDGVAIQVRVYAEDPAKDFQPCAGVLTQAQFPSATRVDTWVERGTEVTPHYDPLLAKLIVRAPTRAHAVHAMRASLAQTRLDGIETNLDHLRRILEDDVFRDGRQTTAYLSGFPYRPRTIDVLEPGVQTTVQDWPGRVGYWQVGVPPSGPMDALAFRIANRLLSNPPQAAGLEITARGPTLRFNIDTVIALCGADMQADLNGQPLENWSAHRVSAGAALRFRASPAAGLRAYLAVAGGIEVAEYLGSKSTFTLGQFGGHGGRALRPGDVLRIGAAVPGSRGAPRRAQFPAYDHHWEIGVLYGPHAAPDFFTDADIETFFQTDWEVHYHSSRTGIRLIGPKPAWSRPDGGEAGLHPSNIHDNAYAIGAIDFTGDMPVILGPDGPSLGGFVCPAVVAKAELWKLGQLKPGDTVRFRVLTIEEAAAREQHQEQQIAALHPVMPDLPARSTPLQPAVIERFTPSSGIEVVYRRSGDEYVLIEYGPPVLDIGLRLRVHALMQALEASRLGGIVDLTPGVRSLQVHFDARQLSPAALCRALRAFEARLPPIEEMQVPTRIVHLPLAWDDSQTRLAITKYTRSVRPDAPWCPSNIEFIRRINGLDSTAEVKRIVFDASYLVLGLGDVYLGAPVATPLDPRHRLVTTKYNPARTWTPENAVGIGGAYLCVYGMEGPGGYQFVGRTLQMWNRYRTTAAFEPGTPWLLRFFDQIRFFEVSEEDLIRLRTEFPLGRYRLRIEEQTFRFDEYRRFLEANGSAIATFKQQQQAAFDAERKRWRAAGQEWGPIETSVIRNRSPVDLPANAHAVHAQVAGHLCALNVGADELVDAGAVLAVVESMKTEIAVTAPIRGRVLQVLCERGDSLVSGQGLFVLVPE